MGKKMPVTILVTPIELELDILPFREGAERSFRIAHHGPRLVVSPPERRRRRKCADQAYGRAVGQEQRVSIFDRCDGSALGRGEIAVSMRFNGSEQAENRLKICETPDLDLH